MNDWSWHPSVPPATTSVDLAFSSPLKLDGWQTALTRPPKVRVLSLPTTSARPRSISVSMRSCDVRTTSYAFPESPSFSGALSPEESAAALVPRDRGRSASPTAKLPSGPGTRIRPPRDIIKLEDRLYYTLQPPLEVLAASNSLAFPFPPFPYQFAGIAFLYPRCSALLADEMGLGKTMQAITAIRLLLHAGELRSVLLVCPKPLVTNWRREFTLWAPELPVTIIEGNQQRRQWHWRLPDAPIKIANYELLLRDCELLESPAMRFDLVVLDEAQRIKNRSSTTSQIVRSISRARSWAMTGTPVENSQEDLVGIFEFLSPGYLSSDMSPRRLGRAARDYVLRRTKAMVLPDLPPVLVRDAEFDLFPAQRASYEMAEKEGIVRLTEMGDALSIQHVFELVLRLKQICNFDPATGQSSKLERLVADVEEVAASGQKAIVFSQWVQTLQRLSERLSHFGPLQYHGKVPSRKRDAVIEKFKRAGDHHLLLMSYGAGSVGLNLQFCNYVFLYDRWWNPAVEDQAINRAHRIGVDGPVIVSRFLMLDTIEERIDQVLREKREIFEMIFSQTKSPRNVGMTQDEVFGLFNLETSKGPLKAAA